MHDTATPSMWFGPTQSIHVHVFTGHGFDHFGAGDKYSTGWSKNNNVGQGGTVGGATCSWPQHNRNLWNLAGGPRHG
jgi:hypothetical protein